ncbi:AAA family ATPase [Flavobacterium psychrophilum]|nr:AAA family ATPase [Flavobacterium psychrophilum]
MKISKLHIDQFRHLENLDFDFTYPKDFHDQSKQGKPLDKICFIGQSATGKTSLLELIYEQFSFINNLFVDHNNEYNDQTGIKSINGNIKFNLDKDVIELNSKNLKIKDKTYCNRKTEVGEISMREELFKNPDEKKRLFYFKANIISDNNLDFFSKNPLDLIEKHNDQIHDLTRYYKYDHNGEFIFNDQVDAKIWLSLLNEILQYRRNATQKISQLIHNLDIQKFASEYQKWQKENPNVLEAFAKEFNPIIEKLNLEIDLVNTEFSIPIRNKRTNEIIPIQNTSTGTKGLLLSFLPLYSLDTKDSIILIDEPERSLYPDMQMDLMEHYQKLAPQAQFIVATHSPFIAASFEPEERFILYFNEDGKVTVRAGKSPIGDDPNDMVKKDFDVNYYNKFGEDAYKKYLILKENLAQEKDPIKKKELLLQTVKLGDTYNF